MFDIVYTNKIINCDYFINDEIYKDHPIFLEIIRKSNDMSTIQDK